MVFLVMFTCALGAACLWLMFRGASVPEAQEVFEVEPEVQETQLVEAVIRDVGPPTPHPVERRSEEPAPPTVPVIADVIDPHDTVGRFDDEPPLVLLGLQATSSANRERDAALLAQAMEHNAWADYQSLLERSLSQAMESAADPLRRQGFDVLWNESVFTQAMLRWNSLETLPLNAIRTDDRDASGMLGWFMTRNAPMQEWLLTIRPQDDLPRAIQILHDVRYGDAEQFEKYFSLALACSVVFDREVRVQHPPQSAGYDARVTIDPLERFRWFVDQNEANRLAAPIERMEARDLVWVVCAPIATSEMDWAINRMRLRRTRWGDAYGMIEYLMERAVSNVNPYSEYTFAEILKHGGICGDQSYFCANTARANGIPAIILSGETDIGPHAWVALKSKPDEWTTLIGRIGGVSNGTSRNPQTGQSLSEQEIWLWNERDFRSNDSLAAIFRYHWIADLISRTIGDDDLVENAIRQANRAGRNVPDTWARLSAMLATKTREADDPGAQPIVDMWSRFVSEMKAQFRENPRMASLASQIEDEFIFPHLEPNDARRMLARERRRLERNADEQTDLVAASLKREADLIADRGEVDALTQISRLYSRALRNYGDSITGFKMMAEDYFSFVKDDPDLARAAVRDIELAFNRVVSTGTTEWFRANTEVSIHRMITRYYRQVGDESRAETLERRLERQMRRAERGASR